mmetsp:Transcript_32880/g.29175  ORF Transcript_32880/g.29175 Transcript_32880/m.29175 type:complete len:83 (-) Transcript_32880:28-276(-)
MEYEPDQDVDYNLNYQEYEYQDTSDADGEGEGELQSDNMYDSDAENRQFNTYGNMNSEMLNNLNFDKQDLHKTSLFRAPKYD